MKKNPFSATLLQIDCACEADRICAALSEQVLHRFRKKGVVVGLSGGVDSSTVAALAVLALGKERVRGLLMPERHSAADTLPLGMEAARHLGVETIHEDISGILEAAGCYRRQEEAVRLVLPDYRSGWKFKIVLPSDLNQYRIFSIVAESPAGERTQVRLSTEAYLGLVAATNFKQRTRKMLEYYHADRSNYAVAGTPNRLEYELGFFVKLGDGAADVKPIAHLYKTQVYQIAEYLGVPESIRSRPPTTDTYSLPQSQEEFYFSLPYHQMDLVLYGSNNDYTAAEIAPALGLETEQVELILKDIEAKRRVAAYLHAAPLTLLSSLDSHLPQQSIPISSPRHSPLPA